MRLISILTLAFLIPCLAAQELDTHTTDSPSAVVASLHEGLITSMKQGDSITYDERYQLLTPLVQRTHRFPFIVKTILGKHWKQLDTEQQAIFIQEFTAYTIASYAQHFNQYDEEQFEIYSEQKSKRGRMRVQSKLLRPPADDISFDYILDTADGEWKIVNIIAQGVSDLALKRTEYNAIITREGFNTLLTKLREKTEEIRKGSL